MGGSACCGKGYKADAAIATEATDMDICLAWRGSLTGKVLGTFFWGLSGPAEGIKRRVVPGVPEWLKKSQANK